MAKFEIRKKEQTTHKKKRGKTTRATKKKFEMQMEILRNH